MKTFLVIFGIVLVFVGYVFYMRGISKLQKSNGEGSTRSRRPVKHPKLKKTIMTVLSIIIIFSPYVFETITIDSHAQTRTMFPKEVDKKMETPTKLSASDGDNFAGSDALDSEFTPLASNKETELREYPKAYQVALENPAIVDYMDANGILEKFSHTKETFMEMLRVLAEIQTNHPNVSFVTASAFGVNLTEEIPIDELLKKAAEAGYDSSTAITSLGFIARPQGDVLVNSGGVSAQEDAQYRASHSSTVVSYPVDTTGSKSILFDLNIPTPEETKQLAKEYKVEIDKNSPLLVASAFSPLNEFLFGEVAHAAEGDIGLEWIKTDVVKDESYLSSKYGEEKYIITYERSWEEETTTETVITTEYDLEWDEPRITYLNPIMAQQAIGWLEPCLNPITGMVEGHKWVQAYQSYVDHYTEEVVSAGGKRRVHLTSTSKETITTTTTKTETSTTESYTDGTTESLSSDMPSSVTEPSGSAETEPSETEDTAPIVDTSETDDSSSTDSTSFSSSDSTTDSTSSNSSDSEENSQKSEAPIESGQPSDAIVTEDPENEIPQIVTGEDIQIVDNLEDVETTQQSSEQQQVAPNAVSDNDQQPPAPNDVGEDQQLPPAPSEEVPVMEVPTEESSPIDTITSTGAKITTSAAGAVAFAGTWLGDDKKRVLASIVRTAFKS